jgi:CRISPR-associated endonuclease Csn1
MRYRLALDIGTNSIGWAILRLDKEGNPAELIRIGSRIYPDGRHPKTGESLGTNRREPRSQRRRRDRYLQRRGALLKYLQQYGLFPKLHSAEADALRQKNPYQLRSKGLDEALTPYELGRAIFHLNQRRGFKSNRKTDRAAANESGKIRQAVQSFENAMQEDQVRTVGEMLYQRLQENPDAGTRARLRGSGAKATYNFYISRKMIEEEFDALWQAQQAWHPNLLTEEAYNALHRIIFHQRELKEPPVGRCTLLPEESRAAKALPSSQRFRLYQEINHLKCIDLRTGEECHPSQEQRDQLAAYLERRSNAKYVDLRKQLFGKTAYEKYQFSIEATALARKNLYGNTTTHKLKNDKAFGPAWHKFAPETQDYIVGKLLETEDEAELIDWLIAEHGLPPEAAMHVAGVSLEEGHLRFSEQAVNHVLPHLVNGWNTDEDKPLTYDQAVRAAGFKDHRIQSPDNLLDQLPYYGEILWRHCQDMPTATDPREREYGRITNPTVHIGLNQLRRLLNALIRQYGRPNEMHIELARKLKLNRESKAEMMRQNRLNRERNERLNEELSDLRQKQNAANRLRLKLFKELDTLNPRCIYSGDPINPHQLFTNAYQIDHILPFSKTLDDGYNNKVLVTDQANKAKGNRSVYELGQLPGYDWEEIKARATRLPYAKRKRFAPDALEQWAGNIGEFSKDGAGFLQRQLTDTAYLARVTREYLQTICPANKIVTSPGRLTAQLRAKWGWNKLLNDDNSKNRDDHRHHAIDAVAIGLIDRKMLQKVSTRAARAKEQDAENLLKGVHEDLPWENLREQIEHALDRCVVSHKPDHNPQAQLHEATAYGIVSGPDDKGIYQARNKVALSSLTRKDFAMLQNPHLAERLQQLTEGLTDADIKERLAELANQKGWPRKTYILRKISGVTVELKGTALSPDPEKRPIHPAKLYRGGANYCYEIYQTENGKWGGDLISTFVANQSRYQAFTRDLSHFQEQTFHGQSLVMRLINNDMIAVGEPGQRRILRVQKMSKGMICLCDHFDANVDARNRDKDDPFSYIYKSPNALREMRARKVHIDMLGRIKDPGFSG